MNYPREFPNDVNYTVGKSNWATDWNFVQNYDTRYYKTAPVWKVNFNLTNAPTAGTNASLYVAVAAANSSGFIVYVNGTRVTKATTGTYFPNYSDAMLRKGIHGAFGDVRLTFPAKYLKAGSNQITLSLRITGGGTDGDIMYDYLRLEATGTSLVDSTLPVNFLPLTAVKETNAVTLHWATLSEKDKKYFEVLRSTNGVDFTSIGKVSSVGNTISTTSYSFSDKTFGSTLNYYRIKQVDQLGKFIFSNVASVNINQNSSELVAYPNPTLGNLNVNFTSGKSGNVEYIITNTRGAVVDRKNINIVAGNNNKQINTALLASGFYWFNLYVNGTVKAISFIKQ
jgi:hypothetical protein